MKTVKYVRVSTQEQNTARQETELPSYIDVCSGSIAFKDRKEASKLLKEIEGDNISEIHVHSIDRLGRNILDIMKTIEYFNTKGVNLISEKEGLSTLLPDKSVNPISKMLIAILGTIAEFELNRIKERTQEGIARAKAEGRFLGRVKGSVESLEVFLNKPKIKTVIRNLKKGEGIRRTALLSKASITTVQKVKRILETE